jgi:hypothetical protein
VESLDYWRLCDELNVVEAALLVAGEDPSCAEYTEGHNVEWLRGSKESYF